jgi:hypothetical protein
MVPRRMMSAVPGAGNWRRRFGLRGLTGIPRTADKDAGNEGEDTERPERPRARPGVPAQKHRKQEPRTTPGTSVQRVTFSARRRKSPTPAAMHARPAKPKTQASKPVLASCESPWLEELPLD